ncbi:MAG: hypothetical protein U0354_14170 [Candidatus Sericytochromatia bacterium]
MKNVFILGENNSLIKSYTLYLKEIGFIVKKITLDYIRKIKNDNDIILILVKNRDEMYRYIWDKIRIENKLKNPILCLGTFKLNRQEDVRDSIFSTSEDYLDAYRYLNVLKLDDVEYFLKHNKLKKIESEEYLNFSINRYFNPLGLIRMIMHNIKNDLNNRETNFERAKSNLDLIKKLKKPNKIEEEINNLLDCIDNNMLNFSEIHDKIRFIIQNYLDKQ